MIQFNKARIAQGVSKVTERILGRYEHMVPNHAKLDSVILTFPNGLVASSDDKVRLRLAETLGQCGLTAIPVDTVAQSRTALSKKAPSIVLCDDRLVDGKYEDILETVDHRVPVIVVSRTGDWPEYLKAITKGVFDYLAYPLIPGELHRVIRNAFVGCSNKQTNQGGPGSLVVGL